jgi:hypothetical protein
LPESETSKAGPLGYCPPVLFWIAEYTDGSVLCQFDPTTGRESLFKNVDQTRLRSFGWYPVSRKLADLVKSSQLRVNPLLHIYKISLSPGQHLIAHKQSKIHTVMAQVCLQCGYIWQFRDKPGELNYPYSDMKVEMHAHCDNPCPPSLHDKDGQHRYVTPQCPKCGAYTRLVCEKCLIARSKYANGEQFDFRCAQCQGDLPDRTRSVTFEERHTDYFLGYEEDGRRFIMKITENGDVEVS